MSLLGFLATIGSAVIGAESQGSANRKNIQLAREQMAFQERMSGSAYQRAVKDMSLAGLNPMLAYEQGGASTPPGAKAEVEPKVSGSAISSALAVAQIAQLKAQTRNVEAQTLTQHEVRRKEAAAATEAEARVPYSAKRAQYEFDTAWANLNRVKEEVQHLSEQITISRNAQDLQDLQKSLTKVEYEQLQKLEVEIQTAIRDLKQLEIPEQKAVAKLYEDLDQYGPAVKLLAMFLRKR